MTSKQLFNDFFEGKKVAILGFGREGQSTYHRLRQYLPSLPLVVCDQRPLARPPGSYAEDVSVDWFLGDHYLEGLAGADVIIRSPGIPFDVLDNVTHQARITSQTELFLTFFRKQVVGITGTKGKSTTASLLYHILREAGQPALLAGNIGIPCFDLLDEMDAGVTVVFELSSHQLQHLTVSPSVAVLLNIFEEHLDYYRSFAAYQEAKMNIFRWQDMNEYFLYDPENPVLNQVLPAISIPSKQIQLSKPEEDSGGVYCQGEDMVVVTNSGQEPLVIEQVCHDRLLPGKHNLKNIAAAVGAAILKGVSKERVASAVAGFKGLPHRLEYVGTYRGKQFYNDSIATIPEAAMAAVRALPEVSVLILGGKDRGVAYGPLLRFLAAAPVQTIVFTGEAGRRMLAIASGLTGFQQKDCIMAENFDEGVRQAFAKTPEGKICLLSPAAPSYDAFRNFEERGDRFRQLIQSFGDQG
ncbi:MAG: UDP-N-acetylmuramoyl-L-alanine--D-glutamate ligase [Bacteroidales bacterium]